VDNNTWPSAPTSVPIIGLKELQESTDPLPHTHIQFAHCYKQQGGWSKVLSRFHRGGGTLYDLEFLNDAQGRRVAAFGFHAGFAGAAAGALALAAQRKGGDLGLLTPYENETAMVDDVKKLLGGSGKGVKALVIGALGRCGRGAVDLFRKIGLDEYGFFSISEKVSLMNTPSVGMTLSSGIWKRLRKGALSARFLMLIYLSTASIFPPRSHRLSRAKP